MNADLIWPLALLAGIVAVATLVNRYATPHRHRIRRALVLFAVLVIALAGSRILARAGNDKWAAYFQIANELLRLIVAINLIGTLLFFVLLPRVGVQLPMIAGELIAGVGYVVGIIAVLAEHQLDLTSALATGAVVSAILAISMQQTLGNILGGVALQLDGSIHEGNWIQFENGKQGKVRAIRWRHTIVETRDFQTIVVPNAWLLGNQIMILGQRDGKALPQRCWAYFHVDYRFSPQRVCNAIDEGLRGSAIDNVASTPPPTCLVLDFGKDMHDSYANYGVQYWTEDLSSNDATGSLVRKRMYAALQRAGIPLAVPAQVQLTQMHDDAHRAAQLAREVAEHMTAIRTVGLLRSLDEDELRTLADGLQPAPFVAGEVITKQGAVAHYLYILTSGEAEVRATSAGVTHTVAKLHAPDFFGEMGLVTGEPRSADVVAATDVECFRLDKTTFTTVLMHRPGIAEELSLRLAQRRVGLDAAREGLDEAARLKREASERARILGGIKGFFGL